MSKARVEDIWLVRPLGFGMDQIATDAVRQYIFEPAESEGRKVSSNVVIDIRIDMR